MIRFMIDTDDISKLTGHVELLATYTDLVTDLPSLRAKFSRSEIILIHRGKGDPTGEASVFDIEPGALTIPEALALYLDAMKRGIQFLTVYHDRSISDAVTTAFHPHKPYTWDATLDGTAFISGFHPLRSPAVVQCLSAAELDYHADGSLVYEDAWHPRRESGVTDDTIAYMRRAITDTHHANLALNSILRTISK